MIEKISDILIVSDIDGTLLREANGLSEENRAAIKRFTDKGGRFTVSTGRAIEAAKLVLDESVVNAPSIHINGGYFYDWQRDEVIEPNYISPYAKFSVKKLIDKFNNCDCHFVRRGASVNLLTSGEYLKKYIPARELEFFDGGADEVPEDIYKFIVCCDPENMPEIRKFAEGIFSKDVNIIQSSPFFLEILPKCNSKGRALRRLCELLGIPEENSVAVGDYENDIEMITAAGIGAAVDNADDNVKEAADIVLPRCEENAIMHLICFLEEMYD